MGENKGCVGSGHFPSGSHIVLAARMHPGAEQRLRPSQPPLGTAHVGQSHCTIRDATAKAGILSQRCASSDKRCGAALHKPSSEACTAVNGYDGYSMSFVQLRF
jgi:hypothetical protein